jgi:hypothetical protein
MAPGGRNTTMAEWLVRIDQGSALSAKVSLVTSKMLIRAYYLNSVLLGDLNATSKFYVKSITSLFSRLVDAERQARKRTTRCEPGSQIAGKPAHA